MDYEYKRNGTANVFCAIEPKKGQYIVKATERRTGRQFAEFLSDVSTKYETAEKIALVMDNLSTHTEKSLIDRFGKTKGPKLWDRFEVHYTPKHESWLNQAETGISIFSRQCLGKDRLPEISVLSAKVKAWEKRANKSEKKINWTFTYEKAKDFIAKGIEKAKRLIS